MHAPVPPKELEELRGQLEEARRGVALEIRKALADIATAVEAVTVSSRGVEQATESLRVERERHTAGRATTNDLLVAEAELRDQRTLHEIARSVVARAWIDLWLATGADHVSTLMNFEF